MVIYVDVLFVVNFFITYLLLFATSFLAKSEMKQYRAIIASLAGGLYSLVIICDKLNFLISTLGKIAVSILIVFIAFGFKQLKIKKRKPMSFRLNISHSSPALKMKRSKFWLKQEIMPRLNMTKLLPVQIQMQQKSRQMPKKPRFCASSFG